MCLWPMANWNLPRELPETNKKMRPRNRQSLALPQKACLGGPEGNHLGLEEVAGPLCWYLGSTTPPRPPTGGDFGDRGDRRFGAWRFGDWGILRGVLVVLWVILRQGYLQPADFTLGSFRFSWQRSCDWPQCVPSPEQAAAGFSAERSELRNPPAMRPLRLSRARIVRPSTPIRGVKSRVKFWWSRLGPFLSKVVDSQDSCNTLKEIPLVSQKLS